MFHVQVLSDCSHPTPGRWLRIRTLYHLQDAMRIYEALAQTKVVAVRVLNGRRKVIG